MEPNKIVELFAELQTNIRSDLSILSKRIETVERSISSLKEFSHSSFPPPSVLRPESGGHAASPSPADPEHRVESSELHNLLDNFSPKDFSNSSPSFRRDSGRRTETSQFILKDPAIKLTPPKVTCKDPAKIRPKEFTIYFDEIEAFIEIWESQPGNRGKKFDGAENFALKNLKIAEQKQLAKLISVIYDRSELRFVKQSEIGNQIFWLSVTTAMAKAKLSAKMANETSLQACMRELQRIKFISHFGLIDPDAWDDYKKKILDLLAHQDSHGFDPDTLYRPGDYVVAVVPYNQKGKRPKLLPKFRGLYIVLKIEGNNGSSVTCRNVADDTIEIIHAQDLMPIDLRAIENADEIITLAAGLKAVPEYIVGEIHDHRYSSTHQRPVAIIDSELSSLEFRCFYKGLPENEAWWWNNFNDIKHLTVLKEYVKRIQKIIPQTLANGTIFDKATVSQLLSYCRHYNIDIPANATKQIIINAIRSRAESN